MIISSAPVRFSIVGGGSDLPSFSRRSVGKVVSMTLDKRVYVTINESFSKEYRIAYSVLEKCSQPDQIRHPIVRKILEYLEWDGPALEITSVADIPATGTGLGSSSAFTVALIKGLYEYMNVPISNMEIAEIACRVEIDLLNSPIGKQDQYASSLGGLNYFRFELDGSVGHQKIFQTRDKDLTFHEELNRRLLFYHVNQPRLANTILNEQSKNLLTNADTFDETAKLAKIADEIVKDIFKFDWEAIGYKMLESWKIKSFLNCDHKDAAIREYMSLCAELPIFGAKLLGAGGGGFIAMLCDIENQIEVKSRMEPVLKEFKMKTLDRPVESLRI